MDLDIAFVNVGEFGLYQKLLFGLFCLPTVLLDCIASYVQVFLGTTPDHWCQANTEDLQLFQKLNISNFGVKNLTVPLEENADGDVVYSSCSLYNVNFSLWYETHSTLDVNTSWPHTSCRYGWVYDNSMYTSTIITKWDLVCDNDYFQSIMLMLVTFGGVLGTFTFGFLTDRIGRRKSYFLSWLLMTLSTCLTPLSPNIVVFGVLRVLSGMALTPIYQVVFVHMLEFVGPSKRTLISQCISICYSIGYMVLAGMAYLVRDWQWLALAAGLPWIPLGLGWWWLPESPRWLISRGRIVEAEVIIQRVAKVNGCELSENYLQELLRKEAEEVAGAFNDIDNCSENETVTSSTAKVVGGSEETPSVMVVADGDEGVCTGGSYLDLFRTAPMRVITVVITINWIANIMVYDGLSYITTELDVNDFLAFFVSGAVEIPAYVLCWLTVDRLGRKWPMLVSMILCGLILLLVAAIPPGALWTVFAFSSLGKLSISFGYTLIYLFASELFPTCLRAQGVSVASNLGHLLDMLTPYIIYLQRFGRLIPFFILGSLAAVSGCSILILPETLNQTLPERVEDVKLKMKKINWRKWCKRKSDTYSFK